jgi:hypothetical protein
VAPELAVPWRLGRRQPFSTWKTALASKLRPERHSDPSTPSPHRGAGPDGIHYRECCHRIHRYAHERYVGCLTVSDGCLRGERAPDLCRAWNQRLSSDCSRRNAEPVRRVPTALCHASDFVGDRSQPVRYRAFSDSAGHSFSGLRQLKQFHFPVARVWLHRGSPASDFNLRWSSIVRLDLDQLVGKVKRKTLPPSGRRSIHRRPLWASTMVRQTERPIPMPSGLVVMKG